jgi:transposase
MLPRAIWAEKLADLVAALPPGRRRVAWALIEGRDGATYRQVAEQLGIHVGTVHQHMRRVRLLHPELYAVIMAERARQLAERHKRAIARAKAHTNRWFLSQLPIAGAWRQ